MVKCLRSAQHEFFFKKNVLFACMCVPCPRRPEDNSLELLGNEPGSSAKTASALKHRTVSSAPDLFIRGKAWVKSHKWRSEKNLGVSSLCPPCGSWDEAQIINRGSGCLYLLRHLASPILDNNL